MLNSDFIRSDELNKFMGVSLEDRVFADMPFSDGAQVAAAPLTTHWLTQ